MLTAAIITPSSGSVSPSNIDVKPLARSESVSTSTTSTAPAKPPTKAKPRKRVNTAEKRSQHNAIERARRETLNSKFLVLAGLLPALSSHRRPSKSAIVNNSITHLSFQREQRLLAARMLRELRADRDSILEELNVWRARAGHSARHADLAWTDEAEDLCRNVDEETFGTFTNFGGDGDEGEGEDDEEDNDMQVDLPGSKLTSARGSTGSISNLMRDSQIPMGAFDQAQLAAAAAAVAATNPTQAQNVSWSHEFAFKPAQPAIETPQTSNIALSAAIQTVSNAMNISQPPVHLPFSAFIPDRPSASPSESPTSISISGGTTMLTPPRTADGLMGMTYGQIQSSVQQKMKPNAPAQGQFFVNPAGLMQTPSPGSSSGAEDQYNLHSSVSSLSNSISMPNSNAMSTPIAIPPPASGGQWSAQQLLMLQQMSMRNQAQSQGVSRQSQSAYPSHGSFDASSFSSSSMDSYPQNHAHVLSLDPSQFQNHMQRHQQQQQQHQQQTHQNAERIARTLMAHMNNQNQHSSQQGVSYFQQQQQHHLHQQQQQQQHSSSMPLPSPFLPGAGLNMGMTTPGGAVPEEQVQNWRQAALAQYLAQNNNGRGQGQAGMQMGWQGGELDGAGLGLNGLGVEGVTV